MDANKPNAAERELGSLIRTAREKANLTQRELATAAGFRAHSRVSEIENAKGRTRPSTEEVVRLLDALPVDHDERERALGLTAQATEDTGRLTVGPAVINEALVELIDHERAARRITMVGPLLIPGLLQTNAYARAVIGDSAIDQPKVALRAGRRDILMRRRDPVVLRALIDSEALLRPVVPPEEQVEQLRHILDMAALPTITVQIVPSATRGYHPMLSGQYELVEFPTASALVAIDHLDTSVVLRDPTQVAVFREAAEYLCKEVAMSPKESVGRIAEIVNGMETT